MVSYDVTSQEYDSWPFWKKALYWMSQAGEAAQFNTGNPVNQMTSTIGKYVTTNAIKS